MDIYKKVCLEIIEEVKKSGTNSQRDLNKIKLKVLHKYKAENKIAHIPKNADILFAASDEDREKYRELFSLKPVRTISGVAPIALMSDPYPCPHTMKGIGPCSYCPGGPGSPFGDTPQSYTGKEPSTRRSIRNFYDPYLVVFNRLEHYVVMGKLPDKVEIIIQGGTFTFFPKIYQEYFVKYIFKAMNDFSYLFFDEFGNIDNEKFKQFFEVPRKISEDDKRISSVQKKCMFLKYLDLSKKEDLEKAEEKFFSKPDENLEIKDEESNADDDKVEIMTPTGSMQAIEISNNANIIAIKKVHQKVKSLDDSSVSLKKVQDENETSFIRCVGLTIETKSDFGKLFHGNLMLELGCTRVEIGLQSIYDEVLKATNRGNTVADNIESLRILKDLGFKINCHYMPGLPLTTKEMDEKGLRELFSNPDYMPDMLKIYPCMVMEGTKLYDDWKAGKFTPLTTKEAAEIIAEGKRTVPKWCRIMRVQRDIPTYATEAGVDRTNLRQYVDEVCKQRGIKCKCIRCREAGFNSKADINNSQLTVTEYESSHGKEFFVAAEDLENDALFGYCRLRFPSQFLRPEITEKSAIIREIHIYSSAVQIGKKSDDSFQHRGLGRGLLLKSEEIARQNGKNKMVIISAIGSRPYFRKFGYEQEGPYMAKLL